MEDVLLLGHSYGGMVVTGAADRVPQRIARLVYLDAFVPQDGKSLMDYVLPERGARFREEGERTGSVTPPPPSLWGITRPEDAAWLMRRESPHPYACMRQPVRLRNEAALARTDPITGLPNGRAFLEMLDIPYTSCNAIVSALTFNKSYCNKVVKAFKVVNIANSVHLIKGEPYSVGSILEQIQLPMFVKPNESGSSLGVTKVKSVEELLPDWKLVPPAGRPVTGAIRLAKKLIEEPA